MMREKSFIFSSTDKDRQGATILIRKGIETKEDLIEAYKGAGFPSYLSANWDSLYDCLTDLSWIESRDVTIYHTDLPFSGDDDLAKSYVALLNDAVLDWEEDNNYRLFVVFPREIEHEVQEL